MRRLGAVGLLGAMAVWANNTSVWLSTPKSDLRFLAHRGVHQTYAGTTLRDETCTANPVSEFTHAYIENTLPSMRAAFARGAEVVELDVHRTTDGVFAVFHDWTVECRTNGTGQTNKMTMSALKALDVGYGYSADGTTYPLRGTGIGLIPTLEEVLDTFPDGRFLINFKSNKRSEGVALAELLSRRPGARNQIFGVYGGAKPTGVVRESFDDIPGFDEARAKACLIRYAAQGWSGHVPQPCRNSMVPVPISHAHWLWGWPERFQRRMARHGSTVLLLGPYSGGMRINGIDTTDDLDAVPDGFRGLIWTNDLPALQDS